ncbi:MAG: response regulator transcription factor, partial [Actinomycetota bacterium]|nr:response regulator transcription factor [Actinomycetota bacterium]
MAPPRSGAGPIRLLLVDDHQMVLDGLGAMLRPYRDRAVVVAATTEAEVALAVASEGRADVALVDVRIGAVSGLELCPELKARDPSLSVVLLTVYDDEQYLFEALRVGAAGYLTKQLRAEDLLAQLDRVVAGDVVVDPSMAGRVAMSAARL